MKKLSKIFLWWTPIVLVVITALILFVQLGLPNVDPAPDLKITSSQAMIEKGSYLANHVAVCMDCHSKRDWSRFAGPIIRGTEGMGGEVFDHTMGLPGEFYSRNITPFNLSNWSDGEIYRLITTGVSKDNEPIFPIMPYQSYSKMAPEDVNAIIAYLRTLAPIENITLKSEADFPMNFIMRTIPQNALPLAIKEKASILEKGQYLSTIAGCGDCHTPQNKGNAIPDMFMAGGFEFGLPGGGTVRSANITPDAITGIGQWSSDQFVGRFKMYNDSSYQNIPTANNSFNTVMPWLMYKDMKTEDLEAIYFYLQSIKPVNNMVEKFTPSKVKI